MAFIDTYVVYAHRVKVHRIVFPLGHPYDVPSDKIGHQVAKLLITPSAARDRLTAETYLPKVETQAVGALELALAATIAVEPGVAQALMGTSSASIRSVRCGPAATGAAPAFSA